jgi:two-component system heavy metal sensor histidine kinase CusS
MSWKNADAGPRPRTWSLAARLTTWYAGSAFALILGVTGFLYWALTGSLDREDDQHLADKVRIIQAVLANRPGDAAALREEAEEGWEASRQTQVDVRIVYVRILSAAGEVLVETPGMGDELPPGLFPAPAAGPGVGSNRSSVSSKSFRVQAVRVPVGSPDRPPVVVQVAMDRSEEVELLADYRRNLWIGLGTALVLCAVVGHQIAHRGIRPVHRITETARRIRPTHLDERISADRLPAELLVLADTFNQMLDRLEQSFARLSRFSADIAHELRTPVNNLRGEIEVALGRPRTPDEYREVLGSSLEECGRLARMIDSLLFLARAEDPRTQIAKERFELGQELATVREFYEAAATEAGVQLTVAVPGRVLADLNRPLFQRALGNLVANAIAHTPAGGTVTLSASGDETSTRIEVADTGCGIPPEHLPHVFDRFYRVDQVRPSAAGNVGLGLAIVRSIVEQHGGTVEIASTVGKGSQVTMTFPRKMTKL